MVLKTICTFLQMFIRQLHLLILFVTSKYHLQWMKDSGLYPSFVGWAEGYGAFTRSYMDLGGLIDYVKGQQEHHNKKTFEEEYKSLLLESGIRIDDRYFP